MKISFKISLLFLILLFPAIYGSKTFTQDYFPLQVGNSWTYTHFNDDRIILEASVIDSVKIGTRTYYVFCETPGNTEYIRVDSLGRVFQYHNNIEYLWLDFTFSHEATYKYDYPLPDPFDNYWVHVYRDITVDTELGRFEHCVRFLFDDPCCVDEEILLTYAPGIGLLEKTVGIGVNYFIYSAVLNDRTLSLKNESHKNLTSIHLQQNYPNPFNSGTVIRYSIPQTGFFSKLHILIYDVTGRIVKTFVNDQPQPGTYEIQWDGTDADGLSVPSGLYFFTLKTNNFLDSGKMLLIR